MPAKELPPSSTTLIAAGWTDPTNGYLFDDAYTYSETDNAEQEYDGYGTVYGEIDKVFVKLKSKTRVTTVVQGDTATATCTLKVYNGTSWATYQVSAVDFAVSTANDESLVDSHGDNSNAVIYIDVTNHVDSTTKLENAKTRLLSAITETKLLTLELAGYVSCVAGDVGKTVTDDGVSIGTLASYDNVARTWVVNTSIVPAGASVMAIVTGTGAGTTVAGAPTGITIRWSVDAVTFLVCYHEAGDVFIGAATTKKDLDTKEHRALNAVTEFLDLTGH